MNNQTTKSPKVTYIIITIVVVILAFVYFYMKGPSVGTSSTLGEVNMQEQAVGARVLVLLNQINSLKIDKTLFSDPAYLSLRDYTIQVPSLPVGRANPFAPIPGMVSATKETKTATR